MFWGTGFLRNNASQFNAARARQPHIGMVESLGILGLAVFLILCSNTADTRRHRGVTAAALRHPRCCLGMSA